MKSKYVVLLILLITGCERSYDFEYDIIITDEPANLQGLNSRFDDYNSDLPYPGERSDIIFSSNRRSLGNHFDLVTGLMEFSYHEKDDRLNVTIPANDVSRILPESFIQQVNTQSSEYGPYAYHKSKDMLFMYASEEEGHYKMKFAHFSRWNYGDQEVSDPLTMATINDVGDNLYPTRGSNPSELLFCSNREDTVFNIFAATYASEISAQTLQQGDIEKIEKINVLSSVYDDKCPFVIDNLMVFSSNRPGGYGGFDLWYSHFKDNTWSIPQNFGEKINSVDDEYRPVIFKAVSFDLMIFSSNRPGGEGSFDLYIVQADLFTR